MSPSVDHHIASTSLTPSRYIGSARRSSGWNPDTRSSAILSLPASTRHSLSYPVLCGDLFIERGRHRTDSATWQMYALNEFDDLEPTGTVTLPPCARSSGYRVPMCVDRNSLLFVAHGLGGETIYTPHARPSSGSPSLPLSPGLLCPNVRRGLANDSSSSPNKASRSRFNCGRSGPDGGDDFAGDWTGIQTSFRKPSPSAAFPMPHSLSSTLHPGGIRPQSTAAQQSEQWVLPCLSTMPVFEQID